MPVKYELIENKNAFHQDHWCVKILEGDFADLVYQYDVVKVNPTEDPEENEIVYNTITVENPHKYDLTDEVEKNIMGEILIDIMTQKLDEAVNENGTPNT